MVSSLSIRTTVTFLAAALMLSLVPAASHAQTDSAMTDRENKRFCENVDKAEDRALDRLAERKAGTDRSGEVDSKKAERMAELDTRRSERDATRDARYDELRDRATTDEQSAAIEDFIATVEDLVADRKAAVDAAIADFEAAVEALLEERDGAIGTYADGLEADIEEIFADARNSCDNGVSDKDVAQQVREDFTALRETIKAERDQYSFKDELEEARADRKAAVEAAKATFQAGYEDAKAELKSALGVE